MSRTHTLKIWPNYFHAVVRGDKTFELRKNDRDFQVGDTLFLQEYDPDYGLVPSAPSAPWSPTPPPAVPPAMPTVKGYTGRSVLVDIKYILCNFSSGLSGEHVIMAFDAPEKYCDVDGREAHVAKIHDDD